MGETIAPREYCCPHPEPRNCLTLGTAATAPKALEHTRCSLCPIQHGYCKCLHCPSVTRSSANPHQSPHSLDLPTAPRGILLAAVTHTTPSIGSEESSQRCFPPSSQRGGLPHLTNPQSAPAAAASDTRATTQPQQALPPHPSASSMQC